MTRPAVPGPAASGVHTILAIRRCARVGCVGGLLLVGLAGCRAPVTRDVVVDRFDVALTVLADGALDVRETITIRTVTPAGGTFTRAVTATGVDRIVSIDAAADGRPVGGAGGEVRVGRAGDLHAAWLIAPGGTPLHTLTLHYRMAGALRIQGPRGTLRWPALPVDRTYAVGASRIDLVTPAGSLFAAGPGLEGRREPFVRRPAGATVDLGSMAPEDSALITAEIDLGALTVAEPEWQSNALRAHQLMPAFVSAGVCLVGIGFGVLGMMRVQYSRATATSEDRVAVTSLAISPAMVAALVRDRLSAEGRSLVDDMVACGLVDKDRLAAARGLRAAAVAAALVGAIGAAVMRVTLARFGVWPMAVPAGLFVVSALFLSAGGRMSVWTDVALALRRQYTSRL